jgi:hypothetical protein
MDKKALVFMFTKIGTEQRSAIPGLFTYLLRCVYMPKAINRWVGHFQMINTDLNIIADPRALLRMDIGAPN